MVFLIFIIISCSDDNEDKGSIETLQLTSVKIGSLEITTDNAAEDIPIDQPIVARFTSELDITSIEENFSITSPTGEKLSYNLSFLDNRKTFSAKLTEDLINGAKYTLELKSIKGENGETFSGATYMFTTIQGTIELVSLTINEQDGTSSNRIQNIPVNLAVEATFSEALDPETITNETIKIFGTGAPNINLSLENENRTLSITSTEELQYFAKHRLIISEDISTTDDHIFEGFDKSFYTLLDSTFKFPEITDEELLTKVQEQTFKYFWDFGHPTSGLARERNTSGNTVTIGGSGFGVMSILVGIERGFITRQEGIDRLETIIDFLTDEAERYHGAWSHWLNGSSGETIPFSANDDGGDLVETSFMIQGLLTARQYLNDANTQEASLINKINTLWNDVEWDWYTQGGQDVLYWHWSPNFGWEKNLQIRGWNESLIVYILAAASTTHTISQDVYTNGWARNGDMQNGNVYYDITLPLGNARGGPLFFSHYSFLGLDPRNLSDQYGDYWTQNIAHSQINRAYCISNPSNYVGYSSHCWGLTASDNHQGYSAHSPNNDLGVITPTAAISSIPYTPNESMDAIRHFYYLFGDKLWGEYGFYDAFNPTESWYASSYLAIDQGPIICMIENHRTGLLWDLFMSAPEVQAGLTKLGFTYE